MQIGTFMLAVCEHACDFPISSSGWKEYPMCWVGIGTFTSSEYAQKLFDRYCQIELEFCYVDYILEDAYVLWLFNMTSGPQPHHILDILFG